MKRVLIGVLIAILLFLAFQWITFPDVGRLANQQPESTAFMERRKRELARQGKAATLDQQWVGYSRISPHLRRAVLVAEDDAFYQHEGVDVEGLKEALRNDWKKKRFAHGGSTITQQLAKNLYLSPSRNPFRKIKEFLIARKLEEELSKKRILEIYLNVVEFGERVYGAEAASRHYFRKSAAALTPSEAALLAGCLPNPRVLNPASPTKRLRSRQRMILSRMRRWGYLFEKEALTERKSKKKMPEEKKEEPAIETAPETVPEAPQFETGTAATTSIETTVPETGTSPTRDDSSPPDAPTTVTVE